MFIFSLIVLFFYLITVLISIFGWLKNQNKKQIYDLPYHQLTIIIPFRNEAINLPILLPSLHNLPKEIQILLVNDHSTDNSVEIIEYFLTQNNSNTILLHSPGEGKKAATAYAINKTTTELIYFTDADCQITKNIIDEFLQIYQSNQFDFAYGTVVNQKNKEFLNSIFFLDQVAINSVALGLGKFNLHIYCSAANMMAKSSLAIMAINELKTATNLSGDDTTLMGIAIREKLKIVAITNKNAVIETISPNGLNEFLRQRLRWGQKAGSYANVLQIGLSVMIWMLPILLFLNLIPYFSGHFSQFSIYPLLVKLIIDLLFLFLVTSRLGFKRQMWFFIPSWLLNMIYIPFIGLLGIFYAGTWKGRKVRN